MHEHDRGSSLKLREYRLEAWISKVNPLDVREQQHAIEFQDIEGVAQFLQSAIDVGQRKGGEAAKPIRPRLD